MSEGLNFFDVVEPAVYGFKKNETESTESNDDPRSLLYYNLREFAYSLVKRNAAIFSCRVSEMRFSISIPGGRHAHDGYLSVLFWIFDHAEESTPRVVVRRECRNITIYQFDKILPYERWSIESIYLPVLLVESALKNAPPIEQA